MTRVVIAGAAGRMGQALIRCGSRMDDVTITGAVEHSEHAMLGKDSGVVAGIDENGVAISSDLHAAPQNADAVIDFTFHEAAPINAAACAAAGVVYVLGTTGLSDDESASVHSAAESTPVVWAPNMSLGVNLLFSLAKKAASILDFEYDVEIVEGHHRYKKDAPSGTAIGLGEAVASGRNQNYRDVVVHGREGFTGEREPGAIGMHALRAGDIVGDHTVYFVTEGERVELTHRASSRDAFAGGALRAAVWGHGRDAGMYDMHDVLDLDA